MTAHEDCTSRLSAVYQYASLYLEETFYWCVFYCK